MLSLILYIQLYLNFCFLCFNIIDCSLGHHLRVYWNFKKNFAVIQVNREFMTRLIDNKIDGKKKLKHQPLNKCWVYDVHG